MIRYIRKRHNYLSIHVRRGIKIILRPAIIKFSTSFHELKSINKAYQTGINFDSTDLMSFQGILSCKGFSTPTVTHERFLPSVCFSMSFQIVLAVE